MRGLTSSSRRKHIGDLPKDVLFAIFLSLVEDEFKQRNSIKFSCYPWILSEVCRSWRQVCSENGSLWAYLNLVEHDCQQQCEGVSNAWQITNYKLRPQELLRTCIQLERSRDATLSINGETLCTCEEPTSYFRAVIAHAARWGAVDLDLTGPDYVLGGLGPDMRGFDYLPRLFPKHTRFTALRELTWHGDNLQTQPEEEDDELIFPFPDCGILTNVRRATLISLREHNRNGTKMLPWEKLTTLILDNYLGRVTDLFSMLSKCRNLAHLEIKLGHSHNLEPDDADSYEDDYPHLGILPITNGIPLLSLSSVILSEHMLALKGFELLSYIRAPSLRDLNIQSQSISIRRFSLFIAGSGCGRALTMLRMPLPHIFNMEESPEAMLFTEGFKELQNVEYLCFDPPSPYEIFDTDKASYGQFLDEMAVQVEDEDGDAQLESPVIELLPRLQHLELHGLKFDPISLALMVDSRLRGWNRISPLQRATRVNAAGASLPLLRSMKLKGARCSSNYHRSTIELCLRKYTDVKYGFKLEISA